jgi:DnaJ domain
MAQNYYEILGVAETATAAEIEAAFRSKAREVHPDTVPAENAYLRKVAAEAFKDLSEAKAALLDPTARQKYDAGLASARTANQPQSEPSRETSTGTDGPSGSASRPRSSSSSRSRKGASSSQAGSGASRRARPVPHLPEIKNLNSFLFIVLGMATIFFLAAVVWSERMPPVWLAAVTAGLGILFFVNGMRPVAPRISSGRPALLASAGVVVIVLLGLWLLSPSYLEIATSRGNSAIASSPAVNKRTPRTAAAGRAAPSPTVAVVDESGEDPALPTKIWTNLKDGQNYRTRAKGDVLFLDAIANGPKNGGEITKCEFHRGSDGAPSWVGICSEAGLQGEGERTSMATLSQFSDTRLEGSTGDIPVFVMTPVDTVQMGAPPIAPQIAPQVGPPAEGEIVAEPDLSELNKDDRESIEMTCASEKLTRGPDAYNVCLRQQVDALKSTPKPRGLSKLSRADREAVEFACTSVKLMKGPAASNQCLAEQMAIVRNKKR